MGAQVTQKILKVGTVGAPLDGAGVAYFFAGAPVKEIKRVYLGPPTGGNSNAGSEMYVWKADVVAPGYQVVANVPDKIEGDVAASVDADSIIVAA